jgi:DNA polymerase III epsilon subunit-like protein
MTTPTFFVHDTETTGLTDRAQIVEIGSVVVVDGQVVDTFTSLVNPGRDHLLPRIEGDLLPHNNIPVSDVLAADPESVVAEKWNRWRAKWPDAGHHCYNNAFDSRFLRRAPWSLESYGECVMLASTHEMDKIKYQKLIASAQHFGVSFTGEAHRALVDARAAAEVYVEILKRRAERTIYRV